MTVFERITELINKWRMNHYGNYPNRIFLGYEEHLEIKRDMDYRNYSYIWNKQKEEILFGVKVEVVCKEHCLSVGEIIEG